MTNEVVLGLDRAMVGLAVLYFSISHPGFCFPQFDRNQDRSSSMPDEQEAMWDSRLRDNRVQMRLMIWKKQVSTTRLCPLRVTYSMS